MESNDLDSTNHRGDITSPERFESGEICNSILSRQIFKKMKKGRLPRSFFLYNELISVSSVSIPVESKVVKVDYSTREVPLHHNREDVDEDKRSHRIQKQLLKRQQRSFFFM